MNLKSRVSVASALSNRKALTRLNPATWGYIFAFIGTVLFSMKAILVKLAYQPIDGLAENALDAITIMTLRLGFAAPVYILIFIGLLLNRNYRGKPPVKLSDMALATGLGILGFYICAWLDIEGIKYITSQLERLLLFTYPIFVFLFGTIFFKKKLTRPVIKSIILAYGGIAVIFIGGDITVESNVPLGSALVLGCAILFAIFQLLAKPMIARIGSSLFTCCAMLGACCVTFFHFFSNNIAQGTLGHIFELPSRIWLLGIALAFFSTLIPSFLVNIAVERIGPHATAAIGMLSPVATIFMAIGWLGEPFGIFDAIGTALTLFGIGLYTLTDKQLHSP